MNEKLQCQIDGKLKREYDKYISKNYDQKWGKIGSEVGKAMKLYLAINNGKYQDDPDVQAMFEKARKRFEENPEHISSSKSKDNTMEELIERKLEEKLDKIEKKIENRVRRESSKKHGHAEFKKQFQMAFNEHHQVSRRDLEHFIMNHADIVDKRAIISRIQYLLSHGMIESFAPDVYNIRF